MLFTPKESLEDTIVRLLSSQKSSPGDLYQAIKKEGKSPTIQAIYKALRPLIKLGVVVKSARSLAISIEWAEKVANRLTADSGIPSLSDNESVEYTFKSLANLDAYWKHLVKPLQDQYADYPIFIYNPFEIWYHITERQQSEKEYFEGFSQRKQYGFHVIGNQSKIDQEFKKYFQNDYMQIDLWGKGPFKDTDYVIIIQDFVTTTRLHRKMTLQIADIYRSPQASDIESRLTYLLSLPYRSKIIVERNAKKAKLFRKKLFKNFYLPRDIKDKYELF